MDSRDLWGYFQRFFLAATTLAIFYFAQFRTDSGAAGLYFFKFYFFIFHLVATIGAINIFSWAVSQEKENGVMDLLILSGIRPFRFITGRFTGKFAQLLSLIILQLPFCWFGVTLGGVNASQLYACFIFLFSWLLVVCSISFLSSVLFSTRKEAMIIAGLVVTILYFLNPHQPLTRFAEILNLGEFQVFQDSLYYLVASIITYFLSVYFFERTAVRPLNFWEKKEDRNRLATLNFDKTEDINSVKVRPTLRFEGSRLMKQKDDFIHPPSPLIPFVILFAKNPGIGGLAIVIFWLTFAMLLASGAFLIFWILLAVLFYKSWSRLILIFKTEIDDGTLQSLRMLPYPSKSIIRSKIIAANTHKTAMIVVYVMVVISTMIALTFVRVSEGFFLLFVILPILKPLSDYISIISVLRVPHAPRSVSFAILAFLIALLMAFPFVAALYFPGVFLMKYLCEREVEAFTG